MKSHISERISVKTVFNDYKQSIIDILQSDATFPAKFGYIALALFLFPGCIAGMLFLFALFVYEFPWIVFTGMFLLGLIAVITYWGEKYFRSKNK